MTVLLLKPWYFDIVAVEAVGMTETILQKKSPDFASWRFEGGY